MIVRSHLPWPLRWVVLAVAFGFSAALALWAFEHDLPAAHLGTVLGIDADHAAFVYADIKAKRRATEYLAAAPVRV